MANQLDNTTRPLYLDGAAFKALINRIGVLRESLREEMKHMTVEVDSSKFITKDIYDKHVKEFDEYKELTNNRLQEIAAILEKMVTIEDVEEAYNAEPAGPAEPQYEIRTYGVYPFPTPDYIIPTTTEEMEEMIANREPEAHYIFIYRDGEPLAARWNSIPPDPNQHADNEYSMTLAEHLDGHNEDIFVITKESNTYPLYNEFKIYKLEDVVAGVNIRDYHIEHDLGGYA